MNTETVKLGEYLYIKGRIGWKGLKKDEYLPHGNYRIINGEALTVNGIDWNKAGYISKERYEESPEIMLQPNDILLSKDGTIGKIGYITELEKPTSVASGIFIIRNEKPEIIDTKFIYYFLKSPYFKSFVSMRKEGSVIPHLYQKDFVEIDFPLYKIEIQKKIVSILQSIDDKIVVNSKINRNLQEQIQTIFRRTFPKVTENGGNVLNEIINFSNGKKRPNVEGDIPVYGGNGVLSYTDKSNAENCVIIGRVGAYCGSLYLSVAPCWISDNAIKAQAKEGKSQLFIYYLLQHLGLSDRHIGTSQPLLTQGILNSIPFTKPADKLVKQFCANTDIIQKQIDSNIIESKRLSELRDTLLPKLMSSELDVSDIDI